MGVTCVLNSADNADKVNDVFVSAFKNVGFMRFITKRLNGLPPDELDIDEKLFTFKERIRDHSQQGAKILESENFNAVVIWYPPGVESAPNTRILESGLPKETIDEVYELYNESAQFKERYFSKNYWYLNTLARNMKEKSKKGAISALIYPTLEVAKRDRSPVYVEAITSHAKDIYIHYGFKVKETIVIGKGKVDAQGNDKENGEGILVYFMVIDNDD